MFNFSAVGNLTKDATERKVGEYYAISLSIAINRRTKDGDVASYLNATYWSKSNKVVEYLEKGKKIAVTGDWFETREHDGKYYSQFTVRELELVSGRNESSSSGTREAQNDNGGGDDDDGLPF